MARLTDRSLPTDLENGGAGVLCGRALSERTLPLEEGVNSVTHGRVHVVLG